MKFPAQGLGRGYAAPAPTIPLRLTSHALTVETTVPPKYLAYGACALIAHRLGGALWGWLHRSVPAERRAAVLEPQHWTADLDLLEAE